MSTGKDVKIMIVDDQQTTREISAVMLSANGYQVTTCDNCVDALHRLAQDPHDAVLVNLRMPGMEKCAFLKALGDLPLDNPPMKLGMANRVDAAGVLIQPDVGPQRVIWKPFKGSELRQIVREALLSRRGLSCA